MSESLTGAFSWSVAKCNANDVGYSQAYRNERTVDGITYYDCSSFIWYALLHNGWDCVSANWGSTWPFTTSSMPYILPELGFVQVDQNAIWKPMDIVLTPGVHTEFVHTGGMGQGITMGAHTDALPLADQVSINTNYTVAGTFSQLWRYTTGEVGYTSWMGWIWNECGYNYLTPAGLSVNGDLGRAYGMYQFDYQGGLVPFMQSCVDYNPSRYSGFQTYINMGVGHPDLVGNPGLIALFQGYANTYTDEFQYLQDKNAIENYLAPAITYVKANYNFDPTLRNPTILGSLFSMAIRIGAIPGAQLFAGGDQLTDLDLITLSYQRMNQIHYDDGRWITGTPISQLDKCLSAYYNSTDFYVIPYGGYSPTPVPTPGKRFKVWLYQKSLWRRLSGL